MTLYIKKTSIVLFLVLSAVLAGCKASTVVEETVQATAPSTAALVEIPDTPTHTLPPPTATPMPTPTFTPEPPLVLSNWDSLEAGEYIAYEIGEYPVVEGIGVLSLSSIQEERLTDLIGWPITSNGRYIKVGKSVLQDLDIKGLQDTFVFFDLWEVEFVKMPIPEDCNENCSWLTINSNLENVVGSCRNDKNGLPAFLMMVDVERSSCSLLTQEYEEHNAYSYPSWSPDGNWIAFYELQSMWPDEKVDDGLYLMKAGCLEKPETCQGVIYGPYKIPFSLGSFPVWSKDSRSLAIVSYENKTVRIFDLATRSVTNTWIMNIPDEMIQVDWLSDGSLIVSIWNSNGYGLIQYHIATKQTEIIPVNIDGALLFTFTKE